MKEIQLTQNQVALVDDEDFERLNQVKWCADKMGNTFYGRRHSPCVNGKRYEILMHHEVIGKPPKGFEVDHLNGVGTDNQKENLRFVTRRQNCQNKKNTKKTSIYPGVHWQKLRGKWCTQITINGKLKHLGLFTDELKAFEAYEQAVNKLGETVIGGN